MAETSILIEANRSNMPGVHVIMSLIFSSTSDQVSAQGPDCTTGRLAIILAIIFVPTSQRKPVTIKNKRNDTPIDKSDPISYKRYYNQKKVCLSMYGMTYGRPDSQKMKEKR